MKRGLVDIANKTPTTILLNFSQNRRGSFMVKGKYARKCADRIPTIRIPIILHENGSSEY